MDEPQGEVIHLNTYQLGPKEGTRYLSCSYLAGLYFIYSLKDLSLEKFDRS